MRISSCSSYSFVDLPLRVPQAQRSTQSPAHHYNKRGPAIGAATRTDALSTSEKTVSAEYPPFMFGYGAIAPLIAKIQDRDPPEIFNHEYLRFTLGFARESDRAFLPLAKRIGLVATDGKPTDLYLQLLKPKQAKDALAQAMQQGYAAIYTREPKLNELDRKQLAALIVEITGLEPGHATARAIVGTFLTLKELAGLTTPAAETDRRKTTERRKSTA